MCIFFKKRLISEKGNFMKFDCDPHVVMLACNDRNFLTFVCHCFFYHCLKVLYGGNGVQKETRGCCSFFTLTGKTLSLRKATITHFLFIDWL